jgi:hypothetical protein
MKSTRQVYFLCPKFISSKLDRHCFMFTSEYPQLWNSCFEECVLVSVQKSIV